MPRPQPLDQILTRDAALAPWLARHRLDTRLTALLRAHLPRALGPHMRAAATDTRCLELVASGGAIAAVLRQRTPDLLVALRREGMDFTEIRVRVQVGTTASRIDKPSKKPRDTSPAGSLFELADRLAEGPLRRSLVRWSRRARGR